MLMDVMQIPVGFVDLGGSAFHVSDIPTERLESRKQELINVLHDLDYKDHWTQDDRDWRGRAASNLWRINQELYRRGVLQ